MGGEGKVGRGGGGGEGKGGGGDGGGEVGGGGGGMWCFFERGGFVLVLRESRHHPRLYLMGSRRVFATHSGELPTNLKFADHLRNKNVSSIGESAKPSGRVGFGNRKHSISPLAMGASFVPCKKKDSDR